MSELIIGFRLENSLGRFRIGTFFTVFVGIALGWGSSYGAEPDPQKLEFFEKKIRPVFAEHCYSCHSAKAKKLKAGLFLDHRQALLKGGDSGPAIVPGKPDESLLVEAVRYDSYEMPPKGKLADEQISAIEKWVKDGAVWPDEKPPEANSGIEDFDLEKRKSEHWVWQPVKTPAVPKVQNAKWPLKPLDHFILARLEKAGLSPAEGIDRAGLARRLYFDVIGLPPTPEQLEDFLSDDSPDSLERLVDRLLESPHFGERWGRHWLDLVRYAESRGHEFDNDARNAFQYRDYVIRAFNANVPYDQFLREHIAGDLLSSPRLHPDKGFNESILGTGFWFLGEWVHSPVDIRKDESDRFDNMIDVMSKTFLGVTVSCARCHDHKFDAISTADYYSLSGFLQSSDYRQVRFESIEQNGKIAKQLAELDAKFQKQVADHLAKAGVKLPEIPPLPDDIAESVVVDYGEIAVEEFFQDGYFFGPHPRKPGEIFFPNLMKSASPVREVASRGIAASDSFWFDLKSKSEKGVHNRSRLAKLPRSGRTLRTPTFELTDGRAVCRVRGEGTVVACVDSHRLIAGPLHGQTVKGISSKARDVTLDLGRYLGHRVHLEFTPAPGRELAVSRVLVGATPEMIRRLDQRERAVDEKMADYEATIDEVVPRELFGRWSEERNALQKQVVRESAVAMAMLDGTGEDDHILIRGNSSKPGRLVPRKFLTAVAGQEVMEIETGSGRLQLAAAMNAPENPLTHRVIVNRIWHHLMGRGIVPTTDDFGVLGQRPTHQELLDHLAITFLENDRSIKDMIRTIVLSRSYRMSSRATAKARNVDPKNELFHHKPPKRLEGEAIRDALLMVAGNFNPEQFGEPIPVYLTPFMDGRGKPRQSGPLNGNRRRSIYISVRRNFISPFMLAFDTPVPFSTMGRRTRSNVPAQALILMNDPFVVEQAKAWAMRVLTQHEKLDDRIQAVYQAAFSRPPTEQEFAAAKSFLKDAPNSATLWQDLCHALINTKEFIFVR